MRNPIRPVRGPFRSGFGRDEYGHDSSSATPRMKVPKIQGIAQRLPLVCAGERRRSDLELDDEDQVVSKENDVGPLAATRDFNSKRSHQSQLLGNR